MADYKIQIGTILDTKGIDTEINKYHQKKSIEFKSKLDTSGIKEKIANYKAKPIEIGVKLKTTGFAKQIREFKPKTPIELNAKLDTKNIGTAIKTYKAKDIKVGVDLNFKGVAGKITEYSRNVKPIKLQAELNKSAIGNAINEFNQKINAAESKTKIKIKVDPDFKSIGTKIAQHKVTQQLKIHPKLLVSEIGTQISDYNSKNKRYVYLKAKLLDGAINSALSERSGKITLPVDLEAGDTTAFDTALKQKIEAYQKTPVDISAKLIPAKTGFSDRITKTPIQVQAELAPDAINKAIATPPKSLGKIPLDVKLVSKDINAQVKQISKPTELIDVGVKLDGTRINEDIALFQPTATLGIKPDLIIEDVDDQIRAYIPKEKIKVHLDLIDNDVNDKTGKKNIQAPIQVNVELNRKNINEQIRDFKSQSKIKVGVKLDFASHKDGQVGIPQQIKDYKTNTKIKVGVELDRNTINQEIQNIQVNTPIRFGVELDPNGIQNINNQLDNIRQQIQQLGNITINFGGNPRNRGIGNVTSAFERASREVYNLYKQIESMELKLGKLGMSGIDSGNITAYRNQLNQLRQTYENLLATMGGQNGAINLDVVFTEIDHAKTSITELSSSVDNARTKLSSDIKINIDNGKLQGEINSVRESFNLLRVENQRVQDDITRLQTLLNNMDTSDDIESVTSDYQEFLQLLKTVKNSVKELQNTQSNSGEMLDLKKASAMERLNNMFEDGSQAARKFGERARQLAEELNKCGNANVGNVTKKIQNLGEEVKRSGLQTKTLTTRLKEQFSKYSSYLSIASVFMYASQGLRSMFEQVKLIDSAMTELKKVTDETDASYNQFLSNAATRAKEIGTTIDGLVSSTADFARLGYDFADAQGLAEVANIYAVVGDEIEGVEDATQSLISTLAAFKDEIGDMSNDEFALSIVDKMNEVANNYAISSGGIGEALQRSASSMAAANNSLDETIAMITAANEVAQNPEKVGNALKTISMRLRGAKTQLEEMGEDTSGMAESTASLRQEMLALSGVDIMLNENTFKSTYQILDELSQKWEGLSDIAQASLTELMAGKHQGNIMSSLMSNFDTAREALETSLNSAGSAMKEHEKWQQSLEAQILKLKAAWQGLSQAFLSSDFLKFALNTVTELVDGLGKLIDKFGAIPTLLTGFAGFKILFTILKSGGISGVKSFADVLAVLQLAFPNVATGASKLTTALKGMAGASAGANTGVGGLLKVLLTGNPYITAAVVAVGALTGAFIHQKKKAEDLAKSVEQAVSSYKEQHNELIKLKNDYDASNESSMISKYAKLSKGVDGLGRNVSLTADEYSEYQNIVNSIAEQIPSLVSGYDEQGNAILSCKGNVEELTAAYEKLIHAQNNGILSKAGDIEKDFSNTLKDAKKGSFLGAGDKVSISSMELLEKILDGDYSEGEIKSLLKNNKESTVDGIYESLKDAGIGDLGAVWTRGEIANTLAGALKEDPSKIRGVIDDYYTQFEDAITEQKTIAQAKLSEAFDVSSAISGLDYGNINEKLQDIAKQTVNSLDYDFFSNLQEQGKTVEQWTTELLNQLNSIGEADNTQIEAAFDLQTKFNGGDISYGEYVESLRDVESTIDELNLKGEAKEQLKISLGLDDDGIVDQYDALVKRLTSKEIGLNDKAAKNFLNSLSAEELDVLVDIIPNLDAGTTINEIQSLIDEKLATEFTFDIEGQITGIEALNTALSEARSATGLTSESIAVLKGRYEDLKGFNAGALFERTANGVRLNNEELARLEAQYENVNKLDIDRNLNKLVEKYQNLTEEIKTCTDVQEKESLQLQADTYADKIEELQTLAAQYDGLTSAFSKWQQAQSSPNEGDNYDSVFESLEALQESYKAGLVGTDDFRTAVQLMSNEDLSTASVDKLISAYKDGLPKMKRYFTEGQKGCKNFLNDISKLNSEWAHLNEKGEWEINIDVEEAAEKLNMDVSAIYLILDKLKDYGFEINIQDTSVDNLQTKIQQTEAKLKKLGQSPVDINVDIEANSANLNKIESEIENAKNKIKEINSSSVSPEVKTAQLEDAQVKLEALIDKKQEASQPAFMSLDTSQVGANLVDALEKVQAYQTALNELNKLSELKEAGIAIDDSLISSVQEKINECAKAIQGLDEEVKVAIGLEENASIDSIKKAFEDGKIKLDANTDPAVTKVELLAKNIDRIEDKDVTVTVTVNGLDDVKELNKNIDLATKIDGSIDKLSEYVEGAKTLSELDDNITSYVTANIEGNITDLFTTEGKLNNIKVFAEGAKELKGVGSFASKVTADVEGNVIDTPEGFINNLKVFSDSAKDVESIGENVRAKVTAEIDGNVTGLLEEQIDNLKVYSENAKEVGEIGEVSSSVTADVNGNVTGLFEEQIDNLKTYSDNAKEVESIGKITSSVKVDINGNVIGLFEEQIDNLEVYSDSAKKVEDIGDVKSSVTADVNGNITGLFEEQIDNLKVYSDNAKEVESVGDVASKVTVDVKGNITNLFDGQIDNLKTYSDSAKDVESIGDVSSSVKVDINGNVTGLFEEQIDNLKVYSDNAKEVKKIGNVESSAKVDVNGNVTGLFEEQIDNLNTYSDNAKEVSDIGDITSSVTVNVKGNVTTLFEEQIDNLKVYSDNAKEVKSIGEVSSKVTADIGGNVKTLFEEQIDNLKVYADNAEEIKDIGNVSSKVDAEVDGNVIWTPEGMLNNLKTYTKSAKELDGIGNVSSEVTANLHGNVKNTTEESIDNIKVFATGAKALKGVGSFTSEVTANVNGNVKNTPESSIDNLGVFADNANKLKNTGNFTSSVAANVSGNVVTDDSVVTDLEHFASVVSGLPSQTVTVSVTANIDSANINSAIDLLTKAANSGVFKDYKATVQVGAKISTIDAAALISYKPPKKEGTVAYKVDSSKVDSWKAPTKSGTVNYSAEVEALTNAQKHKTGTITYKANIVGLGPAAGTAHVNGSANASGSTGRAFARGDWGIKGSGVALGGELGREIVVRDGKFFTIGDEGAEFFRYKKNDIVFNATQTEALLKYGGLKGANPRGKMLATGTAFAEGNAFATSSGKGKFYNSITGESYGSSDKDKDADKDFEEVLDWIEVIIDRVERSINKFDKQANNIYKSWSSRNKALLSEISEVNKEIGYQKKAKEKYLSAANGVGLSSSWAKKVREGAIDIDTITNETLADKIKDYQKYYEAALDCQDVIEELKETEAELYKQRFDNVATEYEGMLSIIEHEKNMLEEYINQSEAQAWLVSEKYYEALIKNEKGTISKLKEEKVALLAKLQEAENNGVAKNSQAWVEMVNAIDEVTLAIEESNTAILEYQQTIQQLKWEVFDLIQDKISSITEEAEFLIELMSNSKLHEDSGQLTDKGISTMGLHGVNYNVYMHQADDAREEAERLKKELGKDPYDTELEERYREMIALQQEHILAAEGEKEAIRDLVEEGIELELDALQERIDKYNESIDAAKDLYDYQKRVKEQTKEIASLEKQMAAYAGDDSEEAKSKVQELKVSLEEAKSDLEETEYDRYISDQQKLLDDLYLEYETVLNTRFDDIEVLISDMISVINTKSDGISDTLREIAEAAGYKLSDSMETIIDKNTNKDMVTNYDKNFSTTQTTVNSALGAINTSVQNMVNALDKKAETKVNTAATSSAANPPKSTNPPKTQAPKVEPATPTQKDYNGVALAIINGNHDWGVGQERKKKLAAAGLDAEKVQDAVNKLWKDSSVHNGSWSKKYGISDLTQYSYKNYESGISKINKDQLAWTQENGKKEMIIRPSDGAILTPLAKNDSVLNAVASNNIWSMANSPSDFIKDNLNLGVANVPNNSNTHNTYMQNLDKVIFNLPNVKNYEELLSAMQKDKSFEKLIHAMTVDRLAGKSALAKGKAIR